MFSVTEKCEGRKEDRTLWLKSGFVYADTDVSEKVLQGTVLQREVSQKEKNNYFILMHIYGI